MLTAFIDSMRLLPSMVYREEVVEIQSRIMTVSVSQLARVQNWYECVHALARWVRLCHN